MHTQQTTHPGVVAEDSVPFLHCCFEGKHSSASKRHGQQRGGANHPDRAISKICLKQSPHFLEELSAKTSEDGRKAHKAIGEAGQPCRNIVLGVMQVFHRQAFIGAP